ASFGNTSFGSIFTLYGASVDVTYDLNFFGKAQRFLEAQQAGIDFNAIQLRAARLTLVGNIITTAVQEAGLRAQLAAQQEVIHAEQQALNISEQRYALGAIAKNELLLQRTAVAQLQTALPPLRKALAFSRHQLAVLVGEMPREADLPTFTLAELYMPKNLPLTLPSKLAQQRPDIQGAEALLHQASAQLGVATANLYPQFSISSGMGTQGTRLIDLLSTKPIWNLGANLVQPLFHAGELRAYKRAAEADYEQARAIYRSTLLQAFGNVADALQALQHDQQSYHLQLQTEALAKESHTLAAEQFAQGASSQLALLTAQSQWQQSHIAVIQARATLLSDTAALLQALGGSSLEKEDDDENHSYLHP
ncbi:MAG: efflux transporter outer membrane subunit, partial [Mariprofundaceae bacterium]|nr:efflux transporter outer membrane subunit [Mariprofundaceae bacterium]